MIVAYGCSNLLQSVAAQRTTPHHSMHPSLLLRLAGQRCYMIGVGCQFIGFSFAFFARRELPLFLVQAAVAAGLGVMAILGVVVLKWRLPRAEIGLLGLLSVGIAALVISAKPGEARPIDRVGLLVLLIVLVVIALIGVFAARLRGAPGSVALGSLAGLAFGAAAIDSRALASSESLRGVIFGPLLYLLMAHALVGQLLLGMAMQRGSTTAAVAAMDAAATAPAAIIGLVLLGDQIWPGREWLAAVGFLVTLGSVLGLTRYAQPQHVPPLPAVMPAAPPPTPSAMTMTTVELPHLTHPTALPATGLPATTLPVTGHPTAHAPGGHAPGVHGPNGHAPAVHPVIRRASA
jgi:drug/metabolite transporter (DMT)-like permease